MQNKFARWQTCLEPVHMFLEMALHVTPFASRYSIFGRIIHSLYYLYPPNGNLLTMKKRDLTFKPELEAIIEKCDVCSLAMVDSDGAPYVIPMNFGYAGDHIYFHSARSGKKIGILKSNPRVSVAFSTDHELRWVNEEVACSWGMKYRSVLAHGLMEFIDDYDAKVEALKVIMKNYSEIDFSFNAPAVKDVMIYRMKIEKLEGRALGY